MAQAVDGCADGCGVEECEAGGAVSFKVDAAGAGGRLLCRHRGSKAPSVVAVVAGHGG